MIPFHGSQYPGHGGHYESWFVRANDPRRARAFWIRYTRFMAADGRPSMGELWAIAFDGDRPPVAVKETFPLSRCHFGERDLAVDLAANRLRQGELTGGAALGGHRLRWSLTYQGGGAPLLLLPENRYRAAFPKAKSLVSRPAVRFHGSLEVDGETWSVNGWPGSENHNWGQRHTDQYAWGQVAAFDDHPDAFLECATARVWIGPIPTPWLSLAVLRLDGRDYRFNRVGQALRARGRYRFFEWRLRSQGTDGRLEITVSAPPTRFTALTYLNPPGGHKTCLNSKLATARVRLTRPDGRVVELNSASGAAFEILTDREDHGVPPGV